MEGLPRSPLPFHPSPAPPAPPFLPAKHALGGQSVRFPPFVRFQVR